MNTRSKVLEVLKKGPNTTRGVIAVLGGTYASVHTLLHRLAVAKLVTEEHGLWKIAEQQATPPAPAPAPTQAQAQVTQNVTNAGLGVAPGVTLKNRFIIVVDNSSSMQSIQQETERALKQTLNTIRAEAFKSGQDTEVSLYYFGDEAYPATFFRVNAKDM